jgi:hypothetical protein
VTKTKQSTSVEPVNDRRRWTIQWRALEDEPILFLPRRLDHFEYDPRSDLEEEPLHTVRRPVLPDMRASLTSPQRLLRLRRDADYPE